MPSHSFYVVLVYSLPKICAMSTSIIHSPVSLTFPLEIQVRLSLVRFSVIRH